MIPAVVQRVIDWLRAGYPDGVPEQDYMPIIALLGQHIDETEQRDAALALAPELGHDPAQLEALMVVARTSPPSEEEIERVSARLRLAGWTPPAA